MTDITPTDLARFIHPVPVGAIIPAGMEYAWRNSDNAIERGRGHTDLAQASHGWSADGMDFEPFRWTAEPLAAPKPPLPTEVGAVIADVRGPMRSTCHMMTLDGDGEWLGVDADGVFTTWTPDLITDWKPARIVIDEPADPEAIRAIRARKDRP